MAALLMRNNFQGSLLQFYAVYWLFGWCQIVFKAQFTYMNFAYDRLKILQVVLGCGHQVYMQWQKYRHIR